MAERSSIGLLTALLAWGLAAPLSAFDMSGPTDRVTRDDVNSAGEVMTDGTNRLYGGVGGIEFIDNTAPADPVLKPGLLNTLFYPGTVSDLAAQANINTGFPVPADPSQQNFRLDLSWSAPAAGVLMNQAASSYLMRYSASPITDGNFSAATPLAAPAPGAPGSPQILAVGGLGLIANTTYYFATLAVDAENNHAIQIDAAAAATLAHTPFNMAFTPDVANGRGALSWQTGNPYPAVPIRFEAICALNPDLTGVVQTKDFFTAAASTAPVFDLSVLNENTTYYFAARSYNRAGRFSNWSEMKSFLVPVGEPTFLRFSVVDVNRLEAEWSSGGSGTYTFEAQLDDNASFSSPLTVNTAATRALFAAPPLNHNTTYYFRMRANNGSAWSDYSDPVSTMTAVNKVDMAGFSVYATSVSFTWNDNFNSVNLPIRYVVQLATTSSFTLFTSQVVTSGASFPGVYSATFTPLATNTRFYGRVYALNDIDHPSVVEWVNGGNAFATKAAPPQFASILNVGQQTFQVQWSDTLNPAGTRYFLQVSTYLTSEGLMENVVASSATLPGATLHSFSDLLANSSYFVRLRSQGSLTGGDSDFVYLSTMTKPAPVNLPMSFPQVGISSMTLAWTTVNSPLTRYEVKVFTLSGGIFTQEDQLTTAPGQSAAPFTSLSVNTSYYFSVKTITNFAEVPGWFSPETDRAVTSSATLADVPALDPTGVFDNRTAAALRVRWAANANPSGTSYRVAYSTDSFATQALRPPVQTLSDTVTGLSANTTYYFRVQALNRRGAPTAFLDLGLIPTLANPAGSVTYVPQSDQILVNWSANGNGPDTKYVVENNRSFPTPPLIHGATVFAASWPDLDLTPNTTHQYTVTSYNRMDEPSAASNGALVRTLAEVPPKPAISSMGERSLRAQFSPGNNPTAVPNNTQFAVRIKLDGSSGGPLQGRFVSPLPGSSFTDGTGMTLPVHGLMPAGRTTSSNDVWGTFQEWNLGVLISTGLASGVTYRYEIYARNNDNVVAGPSVESDEAKTGSGPPVVFYGALAARDLVNPDGTFQEYWLRVQVVTFTAVGSFHYNYLLGNQPTAPTLSMTSPGWDGRVDAAQQFHDQRTGPGAGDIIAGLRGFRVTAEGTYYLHVLGTGYLGGMTLHQPQILANPPFRFSVDLTSPAVTGISARAGPDPLESPVFPDQVTPVRRPFFTWTAQDTSPIRASGVADYVVQLDGGAQITKPASDATFQPAADLANGNHIFRVFARDVAGNVSPVSTFAFSVDIDVNRPRVVGVGFLRAPVTIEENDWTVGVSSGTAIQVVFTKQMNQGLMANGAPPGFLLNAVRDNLGQPINETVPVTFSFNSIGRFLMTMTPQASLRPGYRYEIVSTPNAMDQDGNLLFSSKGPVYRKFFNTAMDPAQDNVMTLDDDVLETRVDLPAGVWGNQWVGLAINPRPDVRPLPNGSGTAAASLTGTIEQANGAVRRQTGGFGRPIALREFKFFDQDGNPVSGSLGRGVDVTIQYNENALNADLAPGEPKVRESALTLYRLDEKTGVWVRVPGSSVDTVGNRVTATVRHFSVYAVLGAPAMDLAGAYAFPVPFKPSRGDREITFKDLSSQATIKIYTVSGELIRELKELDGDGELKWDVTNAKGEPLASDVYVYLIENDQQKKIGKIMVIR